MGTGSERDAGGVRRRRRLLSGMRRRPPRRRWLTFHRRLVAAVLLALAAGVTVDAVAAGPAPGVPLHVAARDLPAGHRLAGADLVRVTVPAEAVPDGALGVEQAAGSRLSGPLRRGEPVTDARLLGPGLLTAAPEGSVAVTVRVGEPASLDVVRPGDRVSVLAGPDLDDLGGQGRRGHALVPSAVVLRVPESTAGLLSGGDQSAGAVVLALSRTEAARVAEASGNRHLLVALLP